MMEVRGLKAGYGPIQVLHGVDFSIAEGEIVAILGPNGAGKTTFLRTLFGYVPVRAGEVRFQGEPIQGQSPTRIARRGIGMVFEGRRVFADMSVEDNLRAGAYMVAGREERQRRLMEMYERFPRLQERRRQAAGSLSGGEQQMLAFARALMSRPRLLLLDEPSMGLAPTIVAQTFETIATIARDGTTIILVEQNAVHTLRIATRAYVLESGRVTAQGTPSQLLAEGTLRNAYLGGSTGGEAV